VACVQSELTIARLPCLLALFRSAVVVELVVAGFLEGERAVYGAWEDSRP